ncbi:MAG TPA: hypothetical protein PK141_25920, partial [Polyangiaceae bacterium]|nr:hypothetical protein [Polyangiaceae bacterium]
MKTSTLGLTLLLVAASAYACSPGVTGGADAGASDAAPAEDSASPPPADALAPDGARPDAGGDASTPDSSPPDSSPPDSSPPDSSLPDSSPPDSSLPDAADGSVADAADAAVPPPLVTSLVDNVVDYDVNATHVFYRTAGGYFSCELPACTNVSTVSTFVTGYPYMAASNDKFYFFLPAAANQFTLRSRTPAGGPVVVEDTISWSGAVLPQSLFAGTTYLETYYRLNPFVTGAPTYRTLRHNYVTERTPAIGTRHQNFGSSVTLGTNLMAPTGTGEPF